MVFYGDFRDLIALGFDQTTENISKISNWKLLESTSALVQETWPTTLIRTLTARNVQTVLKWVFISAWRAIDVARRANICGADISTRNALFDVSVTL